MRFHIAVLIGACLMSAQVARAIPVANGIPATDITVTASSTFSPEQTARHLIDGSGLSEDCHDNEGSARTMWHTTEKPAAAPVAGIESPAWLRFDFARPQRVDTILIWNHNQAGYTDRGFRKTRILGSADGRSWQSIAEVELSRASGIAATSATIAVTATGTFSSVVIAAASNWGSDCYGLSEVAFFSNRDVPESELPFPTALDCVPRPVYRHRPDGQAGREVIVNFTGARLYAAAELEVIAEGRREMVPVPASSRGVASATLLLPAGMGVSNAVQVSVSLKAGTRTLRQELLVPRQKQWTVMLFPHSHVDIGYTNPQDVVEKIHVRNLDVGLELGRATADRPEGERHVWNTEVGWVVESWLKKATPERRREFVEAVQKGWISLAASYDNANTSACSDEELLHFFDFAREMRAMTGDPVDTMCQFDVPGMSWGIAQAAAQSGVRAILAFPNPSDRIGGVRVWENRPFYWVAPDGVSKVLYLQCFPYNVAWKLGAFNLNPKPYADVPGRDRIDFATSALNGSGEFRFEPFILGEIQKLEDAGSPYDLYPCAWSLCDNAPVDAALPEFVRQWNVKYAFPRMVMAGAHEIAAAFEQRFGSIIPTRRGDLTEYWTDGLGTDARRVGYNRVAKEQLVQAETIWTMLRRGDPFPRSEFYDAWRWIQLGSEHTWGYMMPDHPIAKQIEATKAGYFEKARDAAAQLLTQALTPAAKSDGRAIAVFNTLSWPRSGIVTLAPDLAGGAQSVEGAVSQHLSSGELVFLATNVPALGSQRYALSARQVEYKIRHMVIATNALENDFLRLALDPVSGDIHSLVDKRTGQEFVNASSPYALNSYRYLRGGDAPAKATGPSEVRITVKENGPLVASLLVESKAEGCNRLSREVRIVAGQPCVELIDTVDKVSTRAKEGVHFAFAFNLPGATARMDIPWGIMDPQKDQLDGANKNWLAFQRWIDVSNDKAGATWVGLEAAIVQFGDITANLLGAVPLQAWRKKIEDPATIVSWALNNHWHTNFPLEQGGVIPFRYAILLHGPYDPVAANRFGLEQNRPLVAVPAAEGSPLPAALVAVDNPRVFVSALKPADQGRAAILRLRSLSEQSEPVKLSFPAGAPAHVRLCAVDGTPGEPITGPLSLPPYGLATLRLEMN